MVYTPPDELERLAELRATGVTCPVCTAPIERDRLRCRTCPAPPLPLRYLVAKARLARLVKQ
jgi:hypothetical protein